MAELITPRQRIDVVEHVIDFKDTTCPGAGFSFPADATGIDFRELADVAIDNVILCYTAEHIAGPFYSTREWSYYQPALYRCTCGGDVHAESAYENDCERNCGRSYNMSGQKLAPRSQWGEETGETYGDIVCGGREDW